MEIKKCKYVDLARLEKTIDLVLQIMQVLYEMDDKEYRRIRDFIDSKVDFSLPYSNPSKKELIKK